MGLKLTSIGRATLERAIKKRMQILAVPDETAYSQKLKSSAIELNELIEEVVIPETWFFRDKQPFELLRQHLVKWKQDKRKAFLRLLSAPCSSGEEPYSLVMALQEIGWPLKMFQVVALDISARSLARAQKAEYMENSFRSDDLEFRSRYFAKADNKYILNKETNSKVHFRQGNILNHGFMASLGQFDVIFCKNVLIYLDDEARRHAIFSLHNMLTDDGLIFVGHAETTLFDQSKFIPLQYPQAFAFHKKIAAAAAPPPASKIGQGASTTKPSVEHSVPKTDPASKSTPNLEKARQLADQGLLDEARLLCETSLHQQGPSSQAYFLLGLIHDATGDPEQADKLLRKAIYLEPNYEEALVHLSLLAERTGDAKTAETFKQRIRRLANTK